jgi:hypothetical protein
MTMRAKPAQNPMKSGYRTTTLVTEDGKEDREESTFLDDLESLLGELLASKGFGNGGDGQALAAVLVLVVAIVVAVASHGERKVGWGGGGGEGGRCASAGSAGSGPLLLAGRARSPRLWLPPWLSWLGFASVALPLRSPQCAALHPLLCCIRAALPLPSLLPPTLIHFIFSAPSAASSPPRWTPLQLQFSFSS